MCMSRGGQGSRPQHGPPGARLPRASPLGRSVSSASTACAGRGSAWALLQWCPGVGGRRAPGAASILSAPRVSSRAGSAPRRGDPTWAPSLQSSAPKMAGSLLRKPCRGRLGAAVPTTDRGQLCARPDAPEEGERRPGVAHRPESPLTARGKGAGEEQWWEAGGEAAEPQQDAVSGAPCRRGRSSVQQTRSAPTFRTVRTFTRVSLF